MGSNHQFCRLKYAIWDERFRREKPYTIVSDMPWLEDSLKTNLTFRYGPEERIADVRGHEEEFSLDENGFAYVSHEFPAFDVTDGASIEAMLYPQAEEFLRTKVDGVDRVYLFDHRVRLWSTASLSE